MNLKIILTNLCISLTRAGESECACCFCRSCCRFLWQRLPYLYLPLILNRMCGMTVCFAPVRLHVDVAVTAVAAGAARGCDPWQNCDGCFAWLRPLLLLLLRQRYLQLRWNGGRYRSLRQCRKDKIKSRRKSAQIYMTANRLSATANLFAANYNFLLACILWWGHF